MRMFWIGVVAAAACSGNAKPAVTQPAPPATGGDEAPPPPPQADTKPAPRPRAVETPELVAAPLAGDSMKVTIHRLSNGMTVYLAPDTQEPNVVAYVAVRSGSRNDPESSTGLAHYLEHMLFKGTTKLGTLDYAKEKPHLDTIAGLYDDLRKPGADRDKILKQIDTETQAATAFEIPNELDQLYSRIGITGLNAFTNSDSTVYVTEVPKNRLAQWAKVEVTRYADPVFRLFWPELEAVYEEKNRSLDNPGRRVREAFLKTMFPRHGYGYSTTLGEVEHLKSPAYGDMVTYFNRYYTPGNMAILLAGDVDASVLPLLEKEFGTFQRPAGEAPPAGELPPLRGRTEISVPVPSAEGVQLGWQLVAATHPDALALELMDALLYDRQSGILARELLLPQKVTTAGSTPTFLREAGFFTLSADALAGQSHAELEALLLGLVDKLQRGEFTDTDVATAVLHLELMQQQQLESNNGRMFLMLQSFVDGVRWADAITKYDRMRKLGKADVVRVAKQYLTKDMLVLKKVKGQATPPKITKPGITAVKLDPSRQSAFAREVLEQAVTPIEPVALREGQDYARGTLATGPLIAVANQRNGLFSASYSYDHGRTDDRLVCLALEVLKVSGAGKLTAEQVQRKLHELGLAFDIRCGKNESELILSGIDRNLDAGMQLLREWLASPALDAATIKARVAASLTERANAVASPQAIGAAAAAYARLGDDSDFLVVATNKQLQEATPAQLAKSLDKLVHLKHRTSYFGPRPMAEAGKAIVLGDGKLPARAPRPTKIRKPGGAFVVDQPTAQTLVRIAWPGRPATDDDRAAGSLFREYIAPYLFQEVREARGLAYTVTAGFDPGERKIDEASAFAFVGTQGDKTHDAIDALLAALRSPLDDNRLKRAKETIEQNHRTDRINPRFIAAVVNSWLEQGETADPRAARVARTLKMEKGKLEKWMQAALGPGIILSVTGDAKKLDQARLGKLAPVTVVPVTKLFGY